LNAFRFQSNQIGYWKVNEVRVTNDFNHHFSYYILDYSTYRLMLQDIMKFPELNMESYTLEQISNKILTNDFIYFSHLFKRLRTHQIMHDFKCKEYIEKEFGQLIRELCLEDIRSRDFNHYPSRQKALFCIPNDEGIEYWHKKLINGKKDFQLVQLSLDGKVFIGDNRFLQSYKNDIDNYYRYVAQYWQFPLNEISIGSEIVFEGIAKCIKIIKTEKSGN